MTEKEGAIVSAYTGMLIGSFSAFHEYAELILGRPILTIEFGSEKLIEEIKNKSKEDFRNIRIE